ncbi:glutathione S-transferase family protein [Beggiatoa leptomitoformis]|uniref:Glutathione S-transferase family protein n=1 Tax=Beggiatoa leptomitoformis TaxID=288004 RepID=A0A2N9YB37_9GAMM|nr:glutathione S-transferase family protein [Beggiatoa leptomitoformis]ALG66960.2 glutathione S-transferase family protein [Beggiatoa leptomitoformis]AUI67670.2 glutathione S-transferase family protein [Beggiatoa leptomitoformis]
MQPIELISFNLCPFVQRSVITALYKHIPVNIKYIELDTPPAWFLDISPLGKVPVLTAEGQIIFESAVINEYLDEISPPSLHPATAIRKAHNRAWIEFGSSLIVSQYYLATANTLENKDKYQAEVLEKLATVERVLQAKPFFNGEQFSLVDAAFAPIFMRLMLLAKYLPFDIYQQTPKVHDWANTLLALDAVQKSVVPTFADLYTNFLKKSGSYLVQ